MNLEVKNNTEYVMTLKEVTDLISVQHSKAMAKVEELAKEEGFGSLSKMDIVYNEKGQTIQTYNLTKKQAIAVGARLNNALLMKVINRLEELEKANAPKQLSGEELMARALIEARSVVEKYEEKVSALSNIAAETHYKNVQLKEELEIRDNVIEHISDRSKAVSIGDWAKLMYDLNGINIGQKRLFKILRQMGYLSKYGNTPKQTLIQQKLFTTKTSEYVNLYTGEKVRAEPTPLVTHKGIDKLTPLVVEYILDNE